MSAGNCEVKVVLGCRGGVVEVPCTSAGTVENVRGSRRALLTATRARQEGEELPRNRKRSGQVSAIKWTALGKALHSWYQQPLRFRQGSPFRRYPPVIAAVKLNGDSNNWDTCGHSVQTVTCSHGGERVRGLFRSPAAELSAQRSQAIILSSVPSYPFARLQCVNDCHPLSYRGGCHEVLHRPTDYVLYQLPTDQISSEVYPSPQSVCRR